MVLILRCFSLKCPHGREKCAECSGYSDQGTPRKNEYPRLEQTQLPRQTKMNLVQLDGMRARARIDNEIAGFHRQKHSEFAEAPGPLADAIDRLLGDLRHVVLLEKS